MNNRRGYSEVTHWRNLASGQNSIELHHRVAAIAVLNDKPEMEGLSALSTMNPVSMSSASDDLWPFVVESNLNFQLFRRWTAPTRRDGTEIPANGPLLACDTRHPPVVLVPQPGVVLRRPVPCGSPPRSKHLRERPDASAYFSADDRPHISPRRYHLPLSWWIRT